ncbi:glycosyl hydrolase [Persicobacter diffluens]|uniref:beta-glucosidase n=2 Tax=Persicobacter diffluens TaxID=981 RepID=A0AAN4W2I4_9BACT|nr:glycosyl hydrolase [Persicobacter diffluens]
MTAFAQPAMNDQQIEQKVDALLKKMTLKEKIGQLNQLKGNYSTDIYEQNIDLNEAIKRGEVGALTPYTNLDQMKKWQQLAVDSSRLGIPMLYGADVIHGYRTIFPAPIGQASSWDMEKIQNAERIAAVEATAAGLMWNFTPMLDIARDPRWGRVMEGGGEDPYLVSQIARARVRGIQGDDLSKPNTMMATAKHFAAYGRAEGGQEYNSTEVSERTLREIYLPPFKAAQEEGIACMMNGFNAINGIPATANEFLLKQVLRKEWQFKGFMVSDANSIYELIPHGYAADKKEAAYKAFTAGSDTDLWANVYMEYLPELVEEGYIDEKDVDASVRKILTYKYKMGLFDHPYQYFNKKRFKKEIFTKAHQQASLELAEESMVLLKNENHTLPITKKTKKIALMGPLVNSREFKDLIGNWTGFSKPEDAIMLDQGFNDVKAKDQEIIFSQACEAWGNCPDALMDEAVEIAKKSDFIVLALGEQGYNSGECGSRADITLPGNQEELIERIAALNKPFAVLVMAGRPLVLTSVIDKIPAVLYCWQPGTMAGEAIANLVFGKKSPSAKLPMTLPYALGQVPIYYNKLSSGRPKLDPTDKRWGLNSWSDVPNEPLFAFGHGLTYSEFEYGPLKVNKTTFGPDDTLEVSCTVKNTGNYDTDEITQLYIRDIAASVARPVKELKGFQRFSLKKGEQKEVKFTLTLDDLKYWNDKMNFDVEDGTFKIMVGPASDNVQEVTVELKGYKSSFSKNVQ